MRSNSIKSIFAIFLFINQKINKHHEHVVQNMALIIVVELVILSVT